MARPKDTISFRIGARMKQNLIKQAAAEEKTVGEYLSMSIRLCNI